MPVPNEWFEIALPIEDADALEQDPDKDGFTNLDDGRATPIRPKQSRIRITPQSYIWCRRELFRYICVAHKRQVRHQRHRRERTDAFLKVGDVIRVLALRSCSSRKKERNQYGMKMMRRVIVGASAELHSSRW
jgi:hypothetical protein